MTHWMTEWTRRTQKGAERKATAAVNVCSCSGFDAGQRRTAGYAEELLCQRHGPERGLWVPATEERVPRGTCAGQDGGQVRTSGCPKDFVRAAMFDPR
ncbi:hypothetical protein MHYP_G00053820 [Metynnis hypsauchen]